MNKAVGDKAAIVFASYFYQSIAYGGSVKAAFDLGVNELDLEGLKGSTIPELLVRQGADAVRPLLGHRARNAPRWAFGRMDFSLALDLMGDFVREHAPGSLADFLALEHRWQENLHRG